MARQYNMDMAKASGLSQDIANGLKREGDTTSPSYQPCVKWQGERILLPYTLWTASEKEQYRAYKAERRAIASEGGTVSRGSKVKTTIVFTLEELEKLSQLEQAALFRDRLAETKAANIEAVKAKEARNAKALEAKERELLINLIAGSESEKVDLAKSPTSILKRLATQEQLEQVANALKG